MLHFAWWVDGTCTICPRGWVYFCDGFGSLALCRSELYCAVLYGILLGLIVSPLHFVNIHVPNGPPLCS